MQTWDTRTLDVEPHRPQVLRSEEEGRTILINLPAGEELRTTRSTNGRGSWSWTVRSRSRRTVRRTSGGPGLLALTAPNERHEVRARPMPAWC